MVWALIPVPPLKQTAKIHSYLTHNEMQIHPIELLRAQLGLFLFCFVVFLVLCVLFLFNFYFILFEKLQMAGRRVCNVSGKLS